MRFIPMTGDLICATDVRTRRVYVRADATTEEVGLAVLDGVRHIYGVCAEPAKVIPLRRDGEDPQ